MPKCLRATLVLSVLALTAASAWAAGPYYMRGDFNGWNADNVMTDMGGGHWQGTITGLNDGQAYEYKLANADWSENWPGSNGKIQGNAAGQATFHLWLDSGADGWNPAGPRAGYDDLGWGWEIMGAFNGWSDPVASLTNMGGGLYSGNYTVATPGAYEFKFRKAGDWGISIGGDFGNSAGNASVTTTLPDQVVQFQLDLPNGRWQTNLVPEPATLTLLVGGLVALMRRRRA